MQKSDLPLIESLLAEIPDSSGDWQSAMLMAGETATKNKQFEKAIDFYLQAAEKSPTTADGLLAQFSAGEVYLELGQLTQAERLYTSVLAEQPGNGLTNERMAFLLSITGRRWKSLDHFFVLIQGGDADFRELGLAADVGRPIEQPEFLEKCRSQAADDPLVQQALAVQAFVQGDPTVKQRLIDVTTANPDALAAQALLGELLADEGAADQFVRWHQTLPPQADADADIWFVRGLWARKKGRLDVAADCFWQCTVRTPFHRRAFYLLGQTLVARMDPDAEKITAYSELLIQLSQSIDKVLISEGNDLEALRQTALTLEKLGRIWEAIAWAVAAERQFQPMPWSSQLLSQYGSMLSADLPRILPNRNPVSNRKTADVPQFRQLVDAIDQPTSTTGNFTEAAPPSQIRFRETSAIPFQYDNADDPATKGVRTFEQTGGGVAIIDFDLDGAPDVYFPQGAEWKTGETTPRPSPRLTDQLFRNQRGTAFENAAVGMPDTATGFGQGCAAGDLDNDGFPDLYVANVGRNRLYQNMGDGTFVDITDSAGLTAKAWTVSTMICDLNADGMPDLYDVNYLTGEGLYERICEGRACSPGIFPGARDDLLINQANGQFASAENATPTENSKGLGIVSLASSATARPDLFIANDQVANHFLSNQPSDSEFNIQLTDQSLASGVAFNEDGLPMACMGVAVDDWDQNNRPDIFVTNFHNESNTLYLQDAAGLFIDATNSMGLKAASMDYTGWGTQSLDADLDGFPDLVVANGHVDDYRDIGGEYHMRPQFFHNRGGRFVELKANQAGPWFEQKFLGRGLARIDWNQDGLPEWIVSNINSQASVLVNESANTGNFLQIRLIATQTARDASGAFLTLTLPDRTVVRQVVMGDGYMASNERLVQFGLGPETRILKLKIEWPSASESVFADVTANTTISIVEGHPRYYDTNHQSKRGAGR